MQDIAGQCFALSLCPWWIAKPESANTTKTVLFDNRARIVYNIPIQEHPFAMHDERSGCP
jgi:hypothetical protein